MKIRHSFLVFITVISACSSRVEFAAADSVQPAPINAVNINTASVTDLERLPYIGRKTAESIVDFRETNGPFGRPEQLMLIRGVSETRFVEIRHLLRTR